MSTVKDSALYSQYMAKMQENSLYELCKDEHGHVINDVALLLNIERLSPSDQNQVKKMFGDISDAPNPNDGLSDEAIEHTILPRYVQTRSEMARYAAAREKQFNEHLTEQKYQRKLKDIAKQFDEPKIKLL